jgi:hypothetical protein
MRLKQAYLGPTCIVSSVTVAITAPQLPSRHQKGGQRVPTFLAATAYFLLFLSLLQPHRDQMSRLSARNQCGARAFATPRQVLKHTNRRQHVAILAIGRADVSQCKLLVNDADHKYLDVRTVEEFEAGCVDGSINIPVFFKSPSGMHLNPDFISQVQEVRPSSAHCKSFSL